MAVWALGLILASCIVGCTGRGGNPQSPDAIFFVPGAGGDGGHYDSLFAGLRAAGIESQTHVVHWGMPGLFVMNLQTDWIHRAAEEKLANAINDWLKQNPRGHVDVIAHSAGGGVTLGALSRPDAPRVNTVILLNPSVSPGYALAPALSHVADKLHVFHSDKDTLFLSWRTGTFGTYDNVKTKAAGNLGFTAVDLPAELRGRLIQYPHREAYESMGNDGGHFGTTGERFAREALAPLMK